MVTIPFYLFVQHGWWEIFFVNCNGHQSFLFICPKWLVGNFIEPKLCSHTLHFLATNPSIFVELTQHFWGTPYVSAIKAIFDMSAINIHCPLQIFHSIWNNISKVQLPSLPLLLFHFFWNHNSMGIVSPPFRPKVLWEFHFFCVTPYYVKNP